MIRQPQRLRGDAGDARVALMNVMARYAAPSAAYDAITRAR